MYSSIADCDEGVSFQCNIDPTLIGQSCESVQLLGALAFLGPWPWIPDLGGNSPERHTQLGLCTFARLAYTYHASHSWSRKGLSYCGLVSFSLTDPCVRKRPAFFGVRILLALICTLAEAKFYRTVSEKINERVGRYLFFMLLFSAGMWHASVGMQLILLFSIF